MTGVWVIGQTDRVMKEQTASGRTTGAHRSYSMRQWGNKRQLVQGRWERKKEWRVLTGCITHFTTPVFLHCRQRSNNCHLRGRLEPTDVENVSLIAACSCTSFAELKTLHSIILMQSNGANSKGILYSALQTCSHHFLSFMHDSICPFAVTSENSCLNDVRFKKKWFKICISQIYKFFFFFLSKTSTVWQWKMLSLAYNEMWWWPWQSKYRNKKRCRISAGYINYSN